MPQTPIEITLANLAGGGLMECATLELRKICENIADPNCKADAKRKLVITVLIEPDEKRTMARVTYDVKSAMPGPDAGKTMAYIAQGPESKGLSLYEVETCLPFEDEPLPFEDEPLPFEDEPLPFDAATPLATAKRA